MASNPSPTPLPALLSNKVAIITGGTTGIGRAIALGYLQHGARVAVNYLPGPSITDPDAPPNEADAAFTSLRSEAPLGSHLLGIAGDIALPSTGTELVQRVVQAWGRVDIFVSNAGVCRFEDFLSVSPTLLEHTTSINLHGSFFAVQAAARQMVSQPNPAGQGCSIIGISSISALVGGARQTHYTPTKAGVLSLMQSCAVALGAHNIRCNALLPGTIRTQMNEVDLSDAAKREYMEGRIPLGRLGAPADMVGPAVFLACEGLSGYVTGAQLLVDGGAFVNFQ